MSEEVVMQLGSMVTLDENGPGIFLAIGDGEELAPDELNEWNAARVVISARMSIQDVKEFIVQLIEEVKFLEAMAKTFNSQELENLEAEAGEVLDDE